MVIREAKADEWVDVGELTYAAYVPLFPFDDLGWYGRELRDVEGRAAHSRIIVAELEGKLVGAVSHLDDYTSDPGLSHLTIGPVPGFRMLAVHPDGQGRGIGRSLTDHSIERARAFGSSEIILHTTDYMKVAQALYQRMGFVRYPEIDRQIGGSSPVHVKGFRKDLAAPAEEPHPGRGVSQ